VESDRPGGNLPLALTSFVGREREMAEAKGLLDADRLLRLTGPGGSGKTRLALAVASDALGRFEDVV
jgi:predicted ribonuclease YlaK